MHSNSINIFFLLSIHLFIISFMISLQPVSAESIGIELPAPVEPKKIIRLDPDAMMRIIAEKIKNNPELMKSLAPQTISKMNDNTRLNTILQSIIKNAKTESAISIIINSQQLKNITQEKINFIIIKILHETPKNAYDYIGKPYGLSRKEISAIRELLGSNIVRKKTGYTKEQLITLKKLKVHNDGVGNIKLGMSLDDASKILKIDIENTPLQYGDIGCHSYAIGISNNDWIIRFITENNKIGKIDIFVNELKLANGISVGSRSSLIRTIYKGKFHLGGAHDPSMGVITIPLKNDIYLAFRVNHTILHEGIGEHSANDQVDSFSIGYKGVGSVEGCL